MTDPRGGGRGIIGWFVYNKVAANILMLLLVVGGLVGVSGMRTETFPSIDPRMISITVAYPGAAPYEIADAITSRVEQELVGIEGVRRIQSTAAEGYGLIRVELQDFVDPDDVYNDVETAVNSLQEFPPEDAERPMITKVRVTPQVLTLALHGDVSEDALNYWAETIEDDLRTLPGVAMTNLRGLRNQAISVEISEQALRRYNLSLQEIGSAINRFSVDIPAGTIEATRGEIVVRVQDRRYTGEQFASIVVRTLPDGSALRIGDIGQVVDGYEDINLVSRFNGERAAFIAVNRSETSDTLAVAEGVKDYLSTVSLPSGLQLTMQQDETVTLVDRISLMMRNALLGFALVFLILLLFLDLKLAFWVSAAIPISFLGGLMLIDMMGYSLNMISLFALIVVLGIVVDDGIVTGESIYEAQEEHPGDPDAVITGVKNVLAPVTVGVLTTMAAFAPLAFSTGTMGQIIGVIPVVVISILFISLVEAYFILPAHLSSPTRWSRGLMASLRDRFARKLAQLVDRAVLPTARFAIRWRYATLAAFLGIAIIAAGVVQAGIVRFLFFPQIEGDEVIVTVTMPQGTPFATTEATLLQIEAAAETVRQELATDAELGIYESVSVSIGETATAGFQVSGMGNDRSNHLGQMTIQLVPSDFRQSSSSDVENRLRALIQDLPNIERLEFQSSPIGSEPDIEIELSHPEEQRLNQAAAELKNRLTQIAGTRDVTDNFEPGKTEFVMRLNAEGLAIGLTPAELGRQLREAYFGLEVDRFQRGRSEVIVYVRYPKAQRESLASLDHARIRLPDGGEVPLLQVADIQEQTGYSEITTVNGRRVISVTAHVDPEVATPGDIITALQQQILPELKTRYANLDASFEGETREQSEDLASLLRNMAIALLLIYVVLGAQLRSYVQPFVIMSAIPFGMVGAVLGHWLLGYDLTFISLFGMVALMGVIVNDSVVLIDYLNNHQQAGGSLTDSALAAVRRRFRPILLTTLSTFLGLLPMLLETSLQAQFLIPMVVSLTTGLVFGTPVILLLVPCLIVTIDDVKRSSRRMVQRAQRRVAGQA